MSTIDGLSADALKALTPVVTRSAAAQVADRIVYAVRDGLLRPGDRLPSERALAERFGVSRPTVREALTALELAAIVATHKGRGTSIIGNSSQVAMWGVEILPHQIFEARLAIEPELARLAAEKRYAEDVADIRRVVAELEAEFSASGTYESDLPVHRAIARAARNPILEKGLEDALRHTQSDLWASFRRRAFGTPEASAHHLAEVRAVIEHIEHGQTQEAADVWRSHLLFFRDEMLGRRAATPAPLVERRRRA